MNEIRLRTDETPPSDPERQYLVVYAPWDCNEEQNDLFLARYEIATYYCGIDGGYEKTPWHFDVCHSVRDREILAWAELGTIEEGLAEIGAGEEEHYG